MEIAIKIGTVSSIGSSRNPGIVPDDRQIMVKVLDSPGVVVVDNGRFEAGDIRTRTATFTRADFVTLKGYADARTKVDVTMDEGDVLSACRIRLSNWSGKEFFGTTYVDTTFEIWRV